MSIPIKVLLDLYGHRFCPENVASGDILTDEQWSAAPLNDPAVASAARSYQTMFKADLDALTMRGEEWGGLRRASIADGYIGTNTEELIGHVRCLFPDYFHPDRLAEQGNWPNECRLDITVSRNFSALQGTSTARTNQVFENSAREWNDRLNVRMIIEGEYPNTRITISVARLPGSTLADQYIANSDCSSTSKGRMDIRDWSQPGFPEAVRIHEDGHALGLLHVADGVSTMNPVITQAAILRSGELMDGDIKEAIRVGYTKRISPDPEPWVMGEMTVKGEDGSILGRFELTEVSDLAIYDGKMWVDGVAVIENAGDPQKFILVPKTEL